MIYYVGNFISNTCAANETVGKLMKFDAVPRYNLLTTRWLAGSCTAEQIGILISSLIKRLAVVHLHPSQTRIRT